MEIALAISISLAALAWVVFCVWYTVRAKWWKHPLGRNTFGVSALLAVILTRLAVVTWLTLTPQGWASLAFGIVVYLIAVGFGIQRTVFMEQAQRKQER